MKKFYIIASITVFVMAFSMCHKAEVFPDSGYDERMSGGEATVLDASSKAFTNAVVLGLFITTFPVLTATVMMAKVSPLRDHLIRVC
jgi:hypothetical protein